MFGKKHKEVEALTKEQKTVIVTDSSCDLSDEQLAQYDIRMISLRVICQNAEYRDRVDIGQDELYRLLETEVPKTSLPLPEDVATLYDALVSEGVTDVIHLCISSGLSGTSHMVRMLAQDYQDRMNIRVVDSLTLSTGLGMMVLEVAKALQVGCTPEEAIQRAQEVRTSQLSMFVIRTLEFLRKGGRIGLVEGVMGSILQLKPIIFVNKEGVYETLAKARGYKNAVETMVQEAVRYFGQAKISLSVVHGRALEDAQQLLERLKSALNVKEMFISPVSPVLAIHTGPGLLGIVANRVE